LGVGKLVERLTRLKDLGTAEDHLNWLSSI
jgi:hypothetical protein